MRKNWKAFLYKYPSCPWLSPRGWLGFSFQARAFCARESPSVVLTAPGKMHKPLPEVNHEGRQRLGEPLSFR